MSMDREALTALKIRAMQSENKELKSRIKATINYIKREERLGHTYGHEDIFDVIVGILDGDIR